MGGQFLKVLDAAQHTDVGLVRHKNEDTSKILIPPPDSSHETWGALFMVVDGMGGLGGGDVASQYAIEEIARHYYTDEGSPEDTQTFEPSTRLHKALQVASDIVRDQAPRLGLPRIGATAAGMTLLPSGDVVIFNVGDCRVYRLRQGTIERVSRDQSVMERQIEAGLAPEYSAQATRSSMVTAFLGQPIPLQPNLRKDKVEPGDVYIVCSDGLWSLVDANEIARIVKTTPAEIATRNLIKLALKRGGHDNVTAVVVRIGAAPGRLGGFFRRLLAAIVFAVILTIAALALNMVIAPGRATPPAVVPAAGKTASPIASVTVRGSASPAAATAAATTTALESRAEAAPGS